MKLVLRAHADLFPKQAVIGWDVAFSDQGPMLIEANANPGMLLAQRGPGLGIGATRFGELLAYHLKNVARERSSKDQKLLMPVSGRVG